MQDADQGASGALDGAALRIGIVRARFNDAVTARMAAVCRDELLALGVADKHIAEVKVPGALEVPVALNAMAASERYDALVAIGCVVRGETYHFELVADQSAAGVMRVALDHELPVANAILSVETIEQAWVRADEKGKDAARVAVEMANLLGEL